MRWVIAGIVAAAVVLAAAVAVFTIAWAAGRGTRDGQDAEAPRKAGCSRP